MKIWKKKNSQNVFIDVRFTIKNLRLVSSFVGHEQSIGIVEKYDKKILASYAFELLSSLTSCDKL